MIVSCLSFMIVFTVIVLVHEFGHFIAARRTGIKVHEFSIGFPFSPRVLTLFRHRETEFTVRLLPLGGFVSFSQGSTDEGEGLLDAPGAKKALIFSAGSIFNIIFAFLVFIPVFMIGRHLSLPDAIFQGVDTVWAILSGTMMFILDIFTGHGTMEGLSGPVGIAAMAGQAAGQGILPLLYFAGVLSMSLGIFNLMPLPALDGGQLAILFIEAVRRRPLDPRVYQISTLIGLLLFVVLTVLVTCRDIAGLITL